jgi:vacuole morphology and inheritance protein 14
MLNADKIIVILYRATAPFSGRAKLGREEIKWQELLAHFRSVQVRHEKARRVALGMENPLADGLLGEGVSGSHGEKGYSNGAPGSSARPSSRRRVTGELHGPPSTNAPASAGSGMMGRAGALSPLNPRARGNGLFGSGSASSGLARPRSPSVLAAKQRRTLGIGGPKG